MSFAQTAHHRVTAAKRRDDEARTSRSMDVIAIIVDTVESIQLGIVKTETLEKRVTRRSSS
jgi:hypothetical protein